MALLDRSVSLDLSASSIANIATRIGREVNTANAVLHGSGITNATSWNARYKRIDFESNLTRALDAVEKSDRLFHADLLMNRNPGRFQRAEQVDLYERRIQKLTHPIAAKRRLYREIYGNGAGIDLLNAEYRQAYDNAMLELTDPRQARLNKLTEQFGNSARARYYLNRESLDSFRFAMFDKDEQFIQSAMREKGWTRDQAEKVYFQQLTENTKWLRLIGKNNPALVKNLIPIAKTIGKASGLPIIGAFAKNPALGALTALIGGSLAAGSYSLRRSNTLAKWMNARAVTGDISPGTFSGLAATGMSYEQMLQSLTKYSVRASEARFGGGFDKYAELAKYGVDVSGLFNPFLSAEERRAEEYRVVSSANLEDRAAILSALGMSDEEYRSERLKNTPRSKWSFSDLQLDIYQGTTKTMKENHPILDFFIPDKFYQLYSLLAANKELEDRDFLGDKAVDARYDVYNIHKWDEIRDTAEIDDRYRAGMYDNSVTNNDGDRNINVEIHVASPQIVTSGDPADFARSIASIGIKALGEYQQIIENIDTKRTN